jgi:hypothetical protein
MKAIYFDLVLFLSFKLKRMLCYLLKKKESIIKDSSMF